MAEQPALDKMREEFTEVIRKYCDEFVTLGEVMGLLERLWFDMLNDNACDEDEIEGPELP